MSRTEHKKETLFKLNMINEAEGNSQWNLGGSFWMEIETFPWMNWNIYTKRKELKSKNNKYQMLFTFTQNVPLSTCLDHLKKKVKICSDDMRNQFMFMFMNSLVHLHYINLSQCQKSFWIKFISSSFLSWWLKFFKLFFQFSYLIKYFPLFSLCFWMVTRRMTTDHHHHLKCYECCCYLSAFETNFTVIFRAEWNLRSNGFR